MRQNALTRFAREHCANWDAGQGACVGVDAEVVFHQGLCLLAMDKPCKYFERAVFPTCNPSYRYATAADKYDTLLALYLKINPNLLQSDATPRLCECGELLKERRRLCDKCQNRRRKETYRQYRGKGRKTAG